MEVLSDVYYFNGFNVYYLVLVGMIYLYIAFLDFKTSYIWDVHILVTVIINAVNAAVTDRFIDCMAAGILGFALHFMLFYIVKCVYGEERYGMGDVLLMCSIGMMLGVMDFLQYQFMQVMITGIFGVLLLCLKGKNYSFPMGPVYVFWLFMYIGLGKPDAIGWYFAQINMLLS